ncbi:MAG: hypothetical protein ACOCXA_06325, partial [Planctomycetota bacterium]
MIRTWKGQDLPQVVSPLFDVTDGHLLDIARQHGAYSRIDRRLFDQSQFELIELVKASGLRGR